MSRGFVQSEPLQPQQGSVNATLEHVLLALEQGELALAKDLFARVSKKRLAGALAEAALEPQGFPKTSRITADEVDLDSTKSLFITTRAVWVRAEAASAPELDRALSQLTTEIIGALRSSERGFIVDALVTTIGDREEGFISFGWKQKYVLT